MLALAAAVSHSPAIEMMSKPATRGHHEEHYYVIMRNKGGRGREFTCNIHQEYDNSFDYVLLSRANSVHLFIKVIKNEEKTSIFSFFKGSTF